MKSKAGILTTLSAALAMGAYSNSAAQEITFEDFQKTYDSVLYSDKHLPFKSDKFTKKTGAFVRASRQEGIDYLLNSARTNLEEEGWAYLPDSTWINFTYNHTANGSEMDRELLLAFLSKCDTLELYHTHTKRAVLEDKKLIKSLEEYGDIVFYVPSDADNNIVLSMKNIVPEKYIVQGIISMDGIMKIYTDETTFPPVGVGYYISEMSNRLTFIIANHFKKADISQFEQRAKEFWNVIRLEFEPYIQKKNIASDAKATGN